MNYDQDFRIRRRPEEVFAYLSDPTNLPEWDTDIRTGSQTSPGPMRTGAKIQIERTVPPSKRTATFAGEVTEYTPPNRLAVSVHEGPLPFELRYTLTDLDGTTDLRVQVHSRPHGMRRVLEPIAAPAIRRQVSSHYTRLTKILEGTTTQ